MANASYIASKDILARLLAGENLTVQHDPKAHTASFDTRNRVLTLPQWENMNESVYDMLIGHEVGHALFTPWTERDEAVKGIAAAFDIGGTAACGVAMDYLNVVEDARIERLIKDKFPGLRRDFAAAYSKLADDNFFGLKGEDVNALPLIDRINIHFKLGHLEPVNFTAEEQVFVDRIENAKSFDEVTVIASDLFSYCGNQRVDMPDMPENGGAQVNIESDTDGDQDGANGSGGDGESQDADGASNSDNGDNDGDEQAEGKGDEQGETDGKGNRATATQGASKPTNLPATSRTQRAFDENVKKQFKGSTRTTTTGVLDIPNIENIVHSYKDVMSDIEKHLGTMKKSMYNNETGMDRLASASKNLSQFITESAPTINYMVKQFEMRKAADAAKRTSVSRSGVLDTVRMVNYKINDDIFRRNAVIQDGKNHGLVMFIDWSSSMQPVLMNTVKQLIQLVLFCKKVGIPFEVYAFSSCAHIKNNLPRAKDLWSTEAVEPTAQWTKAKVAPNIKNAHFVPFCLINFLSSKMKSAEFKKGLDLFWHTASSCASFDGYTPPQYGLSSTPLDEAIVCAMEIVPEFQRQHKVQIVNTVILTDGESSGNSLPRGDSYYNSKGYIIDPKTRKMYENTNTRTTDTLLRILRDRTKSNVVGFFLLNAKTVPQYYFETFENGTHKSDTPAWCAANTSWRENGYFIRPNTGYTEEYVIRSNEAVVNTNNNLDALGTGASATRIANAIIKDAAARNKSRVILSRFIDLIAQ